MGWFDRAVLKTLQIECGGDPAVVNGWVNNPADAGGPTKYGISLRFLQHLTQAAADGHATGDINHDGTIDANDIAALTLDETTGLLKTYFWDQIPMIESFPWFKVAWKIFDFAVNTSPQRSVMILQRALDVTQDGVIGQGTMAAMKSFVTALPAPFQGMASFSQVVERELLWTIGREISWYYDAIVAKNEEQATFLNGWARRAFDLGDDLPEQP